MRRITKMLTKMMIGVLAFALLGGTSQAFSLFKFGAAKQVVPVSESKSERTIRCKGEAVVDDKGRVTSCSEGFYMEEESENREERKANLKEKFLGWLGNFKGMFFWAVVGSIAASMLGFGGLVGAIWQNLFGGAIKAAKAMVRGIRTIKRKGKGLVGDEKEKYDGFVKELMVEIEKEQLKEGIQKKVNKLRAKLE